MPFSSGSSIDSDSVTTNFRRSSEKLLTSDGPASVPHVFYCSVLACSARVRLYSYAQTNSEELGAAELSASSYLESLEGLGLSLARRIRVAGRPPIHRESVVVPGTYAPWQGQPHSLTLALPPLAALILKQS